MEKWKEYGKEMITGVVIGFLLYFFLKYIFPLCSPFIFAFITIYLLYPLLYKLEQKCKISKTITTLAVLGLVMGIMFGVVWLILYFGEENINIGSMLSSVGRWKENISQFIHGAAIFLEDKMGIEADFIEEFGNQQLENSFQSMKAGITAGFMKNSMTCMQRVVPVLAFFGIYLIATILFSRDFDRLMEQVHKIGALDAFMTMMENLLHTIGTYLKAQILILMTIAVICCIGLRIAGISYPYLLGIITGILDALPFIGTGLILFPTAVIQLIGGNVGKAVICVVLYILCAGARELLESRLMGKGLGVYPVLLLLSIYAGVKLFGVSGIVKGPFGMVLFKQLFQQFRDVGKTMSEKQPVDK